MIYFDNATTSYPKPKCVYDAMQNYLLNIGANSGRAAYQRAAQASEMVFETREIIAALMNITDSSRLIFTQNATESINLALFGLGLKNNDRVIVSSYEHNSVMRPLRFLREEKGVEIDVIECDPSGRIDPGRVESAITKNTRMVVLNHASNVFGTISPVREIGIITRRQNIPLLVDAAQTAGCISIDVERDHIDLLAFSGHKGLLGPPGIGCLYVRPSIDLKPLKYGGTGSRSAYDIQPDYMPDKYESGTQNLPGIAGLKAGVEYVLEQSVKTVESHLSNITRQLITRLELINEVIIYGARDLRFRTSVISINIKGKDPSEIGMLFDKEYNIAVRVGLHCAPFAHKLIGTFPDGTVRISPGLFTNEDHLKILCDSLCQIIGS